MPLYHLVDEKTKRVVYADKVEDGKDTTSKSFLAVESKTGKPDAPRIFPGFLFHEGEFWAPVRSSMPITDGVVMPVSRENFFRLFTQEELEELYDFENNADLGKKEKRRIRVFLKRIESATNINLSSPMVLDALKLMTKNSIIMKEREVEVISSTFRQ